MLEIQLSRLKFPDNCVFCLSPASKNHELKRVFSIGRRRAYTVKVQLPMCEADYQAAIFKSHAEKVMEWMSLVAGTALGLTITIALLRFWSSTGQENFILNLFSGGIMGVGVFLVIWASGLTWLVPLFAQPESRAARNAVRIERYRPLTQYVSLKFQNELLAELVESASNG